MLHSETSPPVWRSVPNEHVQAIKQFNRISNSEESYENRRTNKSNLTEHRIPKSITNIVNAVLPSDTCTIEVITMQIDQYTVAIYKAGPNIKGNIKPL